MKLQFFGMPRNYITNFKREKQMAMKTTGYKKLHFTVMLYITANGNKLPPYAILNRKMAPKENFCKDVIVQPLPPKCMDDIGVNGRLTWIYVGTSALCVNNATKYACNR
jgi:hypothetical protein